MSEASIERYKKILLKIICGHLPKAKVYLFGSRARKDNQPGSDIDLAIDAGKEIDFRLILKMLGEIEETTVPLTVDLVDLHSASDDFKKEVEKEGILWEL